MEIGTRHFGTVTIDEEKVITFDEGIFGFAEQQRFILLYDNQEEGTPFVWMQSVEDKDLCLPMINPLTWFPNYTPEVDDEEIESLHLETQESLEVYTIVVIPDDIESMTTNLRAPILINQVNKKGCQVIVQDEEYGVRHNLYEQIMKLKEAGV